MTKRITDITGLQHLWRWENLFLAGQPTKESLEELKVLGVSTIYNLRGEGEEDFSTAEADCKELGLNYYHIPVMNNGRLDASACQRISEGIDEKEIFVIHCRTANRVGGWLITFLVKFKGFSLDEAIDIASESGLSNPVFIEQAEAVLS